MMRNSGRDLKLLLRIGGAVGEITNVGSSGNMQGGQLWRFINGQFGRFIKRAVWEICKGNRWEDL